MGELEYQTRRRLPDRQLLSGRRFGGVEPHNDWFQKIDGSVRIFQRSAKMNGSEKRLSQKGIPQMKCDNQREERCDQQEQGREPGFFALHAGRLRDSPSGVKKRSTHARLFVHLLQFLLKLFQLGLDDHLTIRLVRIRVEIILMVIIGRVEFFEGRKLGHDVAAKIFLRVGF